MSVFNNSKVALWWYESSDYQWDKIWNMPKSSMWWQQNQSACFPYQIKVGAQNNTHWNILRKCELQLNRSWGASLFACWILNSKNRKIPTSHVSGDNYVMSSVQVVEFLFKLSHLVFSYKDYRFINYLDIKFKFNWNHG